MTKKATATPSDTDWLPRLAGKFLVFDGPDGSGKSTQLRRFVALIRESGIAVTEVREPGGTAVGERIREILLDPIHDEMTLRCEMMLYMASRSQLVEETVRPALAKGHLVVADRFVSSTFAYQGAAGGLPDEEIMAVAKAACGETWPDLVLIFDADEETASRRIAGVVKTGRGRPAPPETPGLFHDRIEQRGREYQRRVRDGFLRLAQRDAAHHAVINASGAEDDVARAVLAALSAKLVGA